MKTQISRDSFQPGQRYSGVYLQQGRMILDADWNELTEIDKARLVDALRDAIAGGAPRVGGLRVYAEPPGSTNILVAPGALYVDGVPARLDAPAPLAVNAQPEYPIAADYSGQNLFLYADVWERSVSALEQPALMDAALHGADTATRSQTMLQVKWCANATDPLDENANPSLGTAPLLLRLRLIASSGDACDPCASQVRVDERIGNYLFRVEVHDYDPGSQWLTLKWSRDNGAEACAVAAMPAGFNHGDWVWEYFDRDTERLLGNHFAPNPLKLRGLIKESCVTPSGASEPKTWVRQWDGYLRIKLDSGELSGRDRGVALFAGTLDDPAQGRASLDGGVLKLNLEHLELELACSGQRFVPGDYWLAAVRESVNVAGQYVLPAMPDLSVPAQGEAPRGVRHHYLLLGELRVDRRLAATDDAFNRRMAFPPLTDIHATDVGFIDRCAGLFAGAQNVQQALDNLCAIGAEDIAYLLPNCGVYEGISVKDHLQAVLDPDSDGRLTVKAALDTLLCRLDAASVPLDKSDAALCSDLQVPEVVSVQDALGILCARSGGGCAVAASSPEHLGVLLADFANSATATDLWICLKAGNYPLADVPVIANKRSLRICGEGPESVTIPFSGSTLSIEADEVILENLALSFARSDGQLAIAASTAAVRGCQFSRTTRAANGPEMIRVGGPGNGVCALAWRDSTLYAQIRTVSGTGDRWAGPQVVGTAAVSEALLALGREDVLADKLAYDAALNRAVTSILAMNPAQRTTWRVNLQQLPVDIVRAPGARAAKPGVNAAVEALGKERVSRREVASAVESLVAQWVVYSPDYALRLVNHKVGGVIEGCQVDGWLLFGNDIDGYSLPRSGGLGGVSVEGDVIRSGGEDLQLRGNYFAAIKSNLPRDALNADAALVMQVAGHTRLFLVNNSLGDEENSFTAASFVGQGNTWDYRAQRNTWLGYVIADRASFTGNLLGDFNDNANIACSARSFMLANAGNVLVELFSTR